MVQKILHRLLWQRHYWRTVGFSELAELYANRLLRLMAVNMVSGVVGIYMYQLDYPVWFIMVYFGLYFLARALWTMPAAYLIGRIGPKHSSFVSNVLAIPALIALTQLEHLGVAALIIYATMQTFCVTLYSIAHHVNFSKVKHQDHAGKELGFMYIVEKVGTGLSPLIGGVVAYMYGPQATMWAACIIFLVAAGPLFLSPEPIVTHQRVMFRGFNWRGTWRNLVSSAAIGIDSILSASTWSLYLAIAVFGTTSNVVYAQIGGLMTVAFVASLLFSRMYGLLIDRRRGRELLMVSVIGDAVLNLVRPFVNTPASAITVNVANEAITAGYTMPYLKGQYDMADNLPGYRIVYTALMEAAISLGAALIGFVVAGLVLMVGEVRGMQVGYIVAAVAVLPIMMHGFAALSPRRRA
ncbi:MAG TPA: MFS transporter [Candidatus Saccharimonadales bacterium]|jgi:MFS family permease